MKQTSIFLICLIALIFLLASNSFAQNRPEYVQTRILSEFEANETDRFGNTINWRVTANNGETFGGEPDPVPQLNFIEVYPDQLYNRSYPAPDGAASLGVQASFNRQGFNSLEFIPEVTDGNGDRIETATGVPIYGIPIPGDAQSLDFWVWGNSRNYYMEAHLRDFRGVDHVLRMGSIAFRGWRRLETVIPSTIPQVTEDPLAPPLSLSRIVLWTVPSERVDEFYVYLDELNVSTDIFREIYDGDELADPDVVNSLWGQGR